MDLSSNVRELATLLETSVPKNAQLDLRLAEKLPAVNADVAQVQQVVMNLVLNAAEAIGDAHGTVRVTTGVRAVDASLAKSLQAAEPIAPGEYVFVEVDDTGSGMDDATQAKMFDPFFTTKFTGRGLGLAAVLGIVKGHKGAMSVRSAPGRGTTFAVYFPAMEGAARVRPTAVDDYQGSGLVMIVDDDATVRRAERALLEAFGFEVVEANGGRAAVELFRARGAEIRTVVVDMTMPEMNGEETFRALRAIRDDVRVILSSGYDELEATRRFTAMGLAAFLPKPFTPADLAGCLRAALGE
jgi:CheY-like chemotaxis protein